MRYAGTGVAFDVLLPKTLSGLPDLEKSLTVENLTGWLGSITTRNVQVSLPKFRAESQFSLRKALSTMGMPTAFTDKADFSGIDPKRGVAISEVVHKGLRRCFRAGNRSRRHHRHHHGRPGHAPARTGRCLPRRSPVHLLDPRQRRSRPLHRPPDEPAVIAGNSGTSPISALRYRRTSGCFDSLRCRRCAFGARRADLLERAGWCLSIITKKKTRHLAQPPIQHTRQPSMRSPRAAGLVSRRNRVSISVATNPWLWRVRQSNQPSQFSPSNGSQSSEAAAHGADSGVILNLLTKGSMAVPYLTAEQIAQVSGLVAQYITTQREKYAPRAIPLSAQQKIKMAGFFSPDVLDDARLLVLSGERVDNPDFYPMLRSLGFNNLPDQSTMGAITFSDTVVSHGLFTDGLLFHELVHVEQYRQLGVPSFSARYVRGFLNGGGYEGIPLERNAYMLGERYEKDPARHFSVADEVAGWIGEGRF
jgi:Serpin (serine protease inhibitor)